MIELICDGASRCTINRDDFSYHECIRIWQGHRTTLKVAWKFWGMAHALRRSNEDVDDVVLPYRRALSRWERVILQVCSLNGVNWN